MYKRKLFTLLSFSTCTTKHDLKFTETSGKVSINFWWIQNLNSAFSKPLSFSFKNLELLWGLPNILVVHSQGIPALRRFYAWLLIHSHFSSVWEMAAVAFANWTLWTAWHAGKCSSDLCFCNKMWSMQNWSCICCCRCCPDELHA